MCFYQGTSDFFRNPVFCWRLCLYNVDWNCEIFYVFNSSRTKNMMWYGVLGTKELVQKTYKNLEQRVQLEVWAQRMKDADIRAECISRFLTFNGKRKHSLCHSLNTHEWCSATVCVHARVPFIRASGHGFMFQMLFWEAIHHVTSLSLCAVWWSAHVLAESSGPCCFEHPQLCRGH